MGSILDDRHPPSKFHGKFSWFRSFCETCWQSIRRGWHVNTTFLLEGVTCTSASSGFYISCLICLWRKHKGRKASLKMFFFLPRTQMFTLTRCTVLELGQRPSDRPPTTSSEVTASVWLIQNWTSTEPNWIESVVRWRFAGTQGRCQFNKSIIHLSNMLFNLVPAGAESTWQLSEAVNPEASVCYPRFFTSLHIWYTLSIYLKL